MWNQWPSLRFEIDNFSKKESHITSQTFVGGGCEWFLYVYPKGVSLADNHMSLYLDVANPESLRPGWKRSAKYYFVVLNQSDKDLYRSAIGQASTLFCAKAPSWGIRKTLPLSKVQQKGVLENDKLIIEVYIKVFEAFDGEGEAEKKETVDINGFQVFASQVRKKIAEYVVKTEYKNVLSNACSKLSEVAEVGFKLDWLKSKLDEVSLKKKKKADDVDDGSRVQLLEERIKNLEVMESGSKMDCLKSKLEEISLERKRSYDADGSCVQKLEERVKNLEKVSLERKKSDDADRSRVQQYEERIKDLELMVPCLKVELGFKLECLKSKLEEDSLERKKSDDADGSRIQELEESVQNIQLMLSYLKDELDKKKDKSSADGFLLVD